MPNPKLETYKNKATGTVYDFTDADAQSKISATVDLMKDTTGWIGGNECVNNAVSKTENGVTWTVNADKSISAYGQPTEGDAYIDVNSGVNVSANGVAWICKGCPSGGANDKYYSQLRLSNPNGTWYGARIDTGNGYQLTEAEVTANVKIQIRCVIPSGAPAIPQSSPIVFRPMIISPEQYALNPAYRPYHESMELSKYNRSEANVLGAKNLLPNKGTSTTADGITWTVNADGTVQANGTKDNNNNGFKTLGRGGDNYRLPSGRYVLSGNASSACTLMLQATRNGQLVQLGQIMGSDTEAVVDILSTDVLQCVLFVNPEQTVNNVIFYPMLRLATDPDPTYVPYAMTNRELTESLKYRNVQLTPVPNTGTNYEKVVNVAEQLDALITDVGVKFSGYVLWTQSMFLRVEAMRCNATTLLYTIFNVSNTIYNGAVQNGAVTVYKFEGTQMTS